MTIALKSGKLTENQDDILYEWGGKRPWMAVNVYHLQLGDPDPYYKCLQY